MLPFAKKIFYPHEVFLDFIRCFSQNCFRYLKRFLTHTVGKMWGGTFLRFPSHHTLGGNSCICCHFGGVTGDGGHSHYESSIHNTTHFLHLLSCRQSFCRPCAFFGVFAVRTTARPHIRHFVSGRNSVGKASTLEALGKRSLKKVRIEFQ